MGSRELNEWFAFIDQEPIGEERADLRAGIIAAAVGNHGFRHPKEGSEYRALDFMPLLKLAREEPKPVLLDDPDEQSALIMSLLTSKQGKPRVH